jgi:uncharacterized protein YbjQ (UPF0145 family)
MKTKDLAKTYGFDAGDFDRWLKESGYQHESSRSFGVMTGLTVEDNKVVGLAKLYKQALEQAGQRQALELDRVRQEEAAAARAVEEKKQALASMLITSGFNFDGYTVTKYSGYISGDDAVSMDRPTQGIWGSVNKHVGADLLASLVHIRRNALAELKEAAYALGCNAVIGVDFDYLTMDPETATAAGGTLYLPFLFCVTANGNAVVIEKNERRSLG